MAVGYLNANPAALPGVGTELDAAVRQLLWQAVKDGDLLPFPATIDGTATRDCDNPTSTRQDVIRDGMPMGKITASNKYANAVIGQLGAALTTTGTTAKFLTAAEVTELVRRVGATGTFKITGPASAAGTVRTLTATYSATGSGGGVNAVQKVAWNSAPTSGTFTLSFVHPVTGAWVTTAALAFGATCSTTVANAINAVLGTSEVSVAATASTTADNGFSITFSGTYSASKATPALLVGDTLLGYTSTTGYVVSTTTTGLPAAGGVTISALGVNEVQTVAFPIASTGGSVVIEFTKASGARMAAAAASWNTTDATYLGAIQSALDTATGVSNGIVATAIAQTDTDYGFALTFSGTGYAGLPQDLVKITTLPTSSTSYSVTRTTAGVNGAFIAGSWIQPTDGSETVVTLFKSGQQTGVSDLNALLQGIDVIYPEMLLNGFVRVAYIVNYPTDTSMIAWLKAALRTAGGKWFFDDDFVPVA